MKSGQIRWFTLYNQEEHKLDLCNCQINIGDMDLTVNEIKDIVRSVHLDH